MLNLDECAFQQCMVVSSAIACKIPENITNDAASTVCVASIAALVSYKVPSRIWILIA